MQAEETLTKDDRKTKINALLRSVDEDVRNGDLNSALDRIRKVYSLDIKNGYARAYEERILVKMLEKERGAIEQTATKKAEGQLEGSMKRWVEEFQMQQEREKTSRHKLELLDSEFEERARAAALGEIMSHIQESEKRLSQRIDEQLRTERIAREGNPLPSQNESHVVVDPSGQSEALRKEYENRFAAQAAQFEEERERIQRETFDKLSEEHRATEAALLRQLEVERIAAVDRERKHLRDEVLGGYRSVLTVMMQLGSGPGIQEAIVRSLQSSFTITPEEHIELVRTSRLQVYANAVRSAWEQGKPSAEDETMLSNICTLHGISAAEKLETETNVKKDLGLPNENAVILAIDDDPIILKFVEHALKQTYKSVLTAPNVEVALKLIESQPPSLILCDVQMPNIGGFTFYERITAGSYGPEIQKIPFLFMSALTDDFFIRSAALLGVESYITKPFSRETLLQAVRHATA